MVTYSKVGSWEWGGGGGGGGEWGGEVQTFHAPHVVNFPFLIIWLVKS